MMLCVYSRKYGAIQMSIWTDISNWLAECIYADCRLSACRLLYVLMAVWRYTTGSDGWHGLINHTQIVLIACDLSVCKLCLTSRRCYDIISLKAKASA